MTDETGQFHHDRPSVTLDVTIGANRLEITGGEFFVLRVLNLWLAAVTGDPAVQARIDAITATLRGQSDTLDDAVSAVPSPQP